MAGNTYSPYNINIFNELFYRHADVDLIDELPNLFTKLDLFNIALHQKITTETNSNVIKVMELASGKKMDRWEEFMKIDEKRKWKVLLTDFDKTLLPNLKDINKTDNYKFSTEIYSLFDNFPKLKPNDTYDCLLSTYTFDNLWLAGDLHLTKVGNTWFKNLYQLDFSKTGKCIEDIEEGKKLDRQFFINLKIKTKKTKIDLSSIKYGVHINEYYKGRKRASVNFPGGLIKTVVNSFNSQLKKNAIFITADIATEDNNKKQKGYKSVNETIKIKIENYALAKYILEKLKFNVELKSLHEFIKEAKIITPVKIQDHFVLTVKLKKYTTKAYFVYILRTSSNTLYIGQTNNLEKRMKEHKEKSAKSAKYMRYFRTFELVYHEKHKTRSEAMQREIQLKRWPRAKKKALIEGNLKLLKKL